MRKSMPILLVSMPILLVEDDCTDAIIFKRALKEAEITNPLVHSINYTEALEHLRDRNNRKPCIIITDLNTSEMNPQALDFEGAAKWEPK